MGISLDQFCKVFIVDDLLSGLAVITRAKPGCGVCISTKICQSEESVGGLLLTIHDRWLG
jgi:hypothetical protein